MAIINAPTIETPLLTDIHSHRFQCVKHPRKIFLWSSISCLIGFILLVGIVMCVFLSRPVTSTYGIDSEAMVRPLFYRNALKHSRVLKQSGGSVTTLPDGSVLWLFGETTIECDQCPGSATTISSSAMIVEYKEPHHPVARFLEDAGGMPRPVIQIHEPATSLLLGGCSIVNDGVFLHWEKVSTSGTFLASGSAYQPYHRLPLLNVTEASLRTEKSFVAFSLVEGGYLYHYALYDGNVLLGRRSVSDIRTSDFSTEYWNGKEFKQIAFYEAEPILKQWEGNQITVAWNNLLQRYVMLTTSDPIQMLTAENLWGPWTHPVEVFKVPEEEKQGGKVTDIQFHPELWRDDGKIMAFSYCITGGGADGLPYFVETSLIRKSLLIPVA